MSNEKTFVPDAVSFIADRIKAAIGKHGRAMIGLSGGSTPGPVYAALGAMKDIDWSKVWIFLADDRFIRKDSPHSNQFLVRSTLLHDATIPESQILFPDTSLPLKECIAEYDAVMRSAFAHHTPDLLILGMGPDGHTASLFPPLSDEAFADRTVIHTRTDQFDIPQRISLTLPALRKAREALFLLKGKTKKDLWERMVKSSEDERHWPAKAVINAMPTTAIISD